MAVLALLACVRGSDAGVVEDFNHVQRCKDSLYMGTPPRGYLAGGALKKICQRYEEKPCFVTLYDPHKHIPVYSAYTFKKTDGQKTVDFPWMFEPQVSECVCTCVGLFKSSNGFDKHPIMTSSVECLDIAKLHSRFTEG